MAANKPLYIAIATVLALAVLAGAGVALAAYLGLYNVTATREHPQVLYRFLHFAMRRSVSARAGGIPVPAQGGAGRIDHGFVLFREHCVQCHGAPGVAPAAFAFGLRPQPPALVEAAREWPASELYWVIRNGVKMTAMPAWEYRLGEQELWDLAAFVQRLPTLSPADYREWDLRARPGGAAPASAPPAGMRGNASAGRRAVEQYLCATCHQIPGVAGARTLVGPVLAGIASRTYIGGTLPNTPDNMLRWLRDPQQVKPGSAMPNLHIGERDLRDIAAFLYTLDDD